MPEYRNHVELIGQLDREPDLRRLDSGKAVATLSILVKYGRNDAFKGWHRVVVWEADAEKWSTAAIGTWARIDGYLKTRSWTDATGRKQYMTEVVAREIRELEPGCCERTASEAEPAPDMTLEKLEEADADLPF